MEHLRIWYMDTILTSLILLYELKNTKPMPYLSILKLELLDRSGYESRISSCIWYRPDRRVSPYLFISSIRLNWWLCAQTILTRTTVGDRNVVYDFQHKMTFDLKYMTYDIFLEVILLWACSKTIWVINIKLLLSDFKLNKTMVPGLPQVFYCILWHNIEILKIRKFLVWIFNGHYKTRNKENLDIWNGVRAIIIIYLVWRSSLTSAVILQKCCVLN